MKPNVFGALLLLSLLLHLALLLSPDSIPKLHREKIPIAVQFQEITGREFKNTTPKQKSKTGKSRTSSTLATGAQIKDILGSTRVQYSETSTAAPQDALEESWGSGSTKMESVESILFYKTIYEEVDNVLFYPSVLAKRNIQGHIQARLLFDPAEGCLWKKAVISEGNPNLRVFVLDILRRACASETVNRLRPLRRVTADLSFLFEIGEASQKIEYINARRNHGAWIVGNTLMFEAHSTQSALTWELGPFTGVFPIPYVALNFNWLQEHWDEIVAGKIKTLPIR